MMVDDDADLLALLKMKLEKTGSFAVVVTTKGSEAVALASDTSPDLIILDIDMPDMPGGEVADALLTDDTTKEIPVIFLSSLIPKENADEGLKVIGGRQMISKFASVNQLIEAIESILQ